MGQRNGLVMFTAVGGARIDSTLHLAGLATWKCAMFEFKMVLLSARHLHARNSGRVQKTVRRTMLATRNGSGSGVSSTLFKQTRVCSGVSYCGKKRLRKHAVCITVVRFMFVCPAYLSESFDAEDGFEIYAKWPERPLEEAWLVGCCPDVACCARLRLPVFRSSLIVTMMMVSLLVGRMGSIDAVRMTEFCSGCHHGRSRYSKTDR